MLQSSTAMDLKTVTSETFYSNKNLGENICIFNGPFKTLKIDSYFFLSPILLLHRSGIPRDQSVLSNLAQMFPDEDDIDTPR